MTKIVLLGLDHFDPSKEQLGRVLEAEKPDVVTVEAKDTVVYLIEKGRREYDAFLRSCVQRGILSESSAASHSAVNARLWMREVEEAKMYGERKNVPVHFIDDPLFNPPFTEYTHDDPPPNIEVKFADLEKQMLGSYTQSAMLIAAGGFDAHDLHLEESFLRPATLREIWQTQRSLIPRIFTLLKGISMGASYARDAYPTQKLVELATQREPPDKIVHICGANHLLSLFCDNRPVSLRSLLSRVAQKHNITVEKKLLPFELMELNKAMDGS